ncbi:MAG: DUF1778 domain-containing protein [Elusimicrobiota bacterium]|jgi:uncharacterized protein (DUF1778 family)
MQKKKAVDRYGDGIRIQHQVCLSKKERDLVDQAAARQGLPRASFMRQAAMDAARRVLDHG